MKQIRTRALYILAMVAITLQAHPQIDTYLDEGTLEYFRQVLIPSYTEQIEQNPNDHYSFATRGALYFVIGDLDAARKDIQAAIELEPDEALYHCDFGSLLLALENPTDALKEAERGLQLDGTAEECIVVKALCLGALDRQRDALHLLNEFKSKEKVTGYFYLTRGKILLRMKRAREATSDLRKSLKSLSIEPEPYIYLGMAYLKRGKYSTAIETLSQGIDLYPESVQMYELRAEAYRGKGEIVKARVDQQKANEVRDVKKD